MNIIHTYSNKYKNKIQVIYRKIIENILYTIFITTNTTL